MENKVTVDSTYLEDGLLWADADLVPFIKPKDAKDRKRGAGRSPNSHNQDHEQKPRPSRSVSSRANSADSQAGTDEDSGQVHIGDWLVPADTPAAPANPLPMTRLEVNGGGTNATTHHAGDTACAATAETPASPMAVDARTEPEPIEEHRPVGCDALEPLEVEAVAQETAGSVSSQPQPADMESAATATEIHLRPTTDAVAAELAATPVPIDSHSPASPGPPTLQDPPVAATATKGEAGKGAKSLSLILIATGGEPMQARAWELYSILAALAQVSELELRSDGSSIPLSDIGPEAVKAAYLAADAKYQEAVRAAVANPELDLDAAQFRAADRARKSIGRALRDLTAIGAVDVDEAGYPVTLHRLAAVRKKLAAYGVTSVRLCPGGKRRLCDHAGREVRPMPPTSTSSPDARRA